MKRFIILMACFFPIIILANNSAAFDKPYLTSYHEKFKLIDISSLSSPGNYAAADSEDLEGVTSEVEKNSKSEDDPEAMKTISDPLEPFNRFNHEFNDKLYFHVLKPVAKKYSAIIPERVRISTQKFFLNIHAPVRFISCGLQGNIKGAFTEFSRFAVNTTIGIAGFFDPAKAYLNLKSQDEDFGQYMGCFSGPGFYLDWPFLGPSSLRDSIGSIVDLFIVPSYYVLSHTPYYYIYLGAKALEQINRTSLSIGEYEELKQSALDPYIAVRDAYFQHREDLIKK